MYWIFCNTAAHTAYYVRAGGRHADHHRSHGDSFRCETADAETAKKIVAELTECDSVEKNTYCWAHNRRPQRKPIGRAPYRRNLQMPGYG